MIGESGRRSMEEGGAGTSLSGRGGEGEVAVAPPGGGRSGRPPGACVREGGWGEDGH